MWKNAVTGRDLARCIEYARAHSALYREKFKHLPHFQNGITRAEFETIPFTDKDDLRGASPLAHCAAAEQDIVRIHTTSGTTGTAIIMPYTQGDIDDWTDMMSRCFTIAGVGALDRVQITPGFGLWTAGIGFQAGAERVGAMVIPTGSGNTARQISMLIDMKATVLCATASYALLLAEQVRMRGLAPQIHLNTIILGSEVCNDKMMNAIRQGFGAVRIYDIYGLTEIYGPGIAISCAAGRGLHYWDDALYFEIIDPATGQALPIGQTGELVITTYKKMGAPLIRFRTHDITSLLPGECPCGLETPAISRISGRTDDTVKVKGVQVHPRQIGDILMRVAEAAGEYLITIDRVDGCDRMTVQFEIQDMTKSGDAEAAVKSRIKEEFGLTADVKAIQKGGLPRSEKKTRRIVDRRD